MTDESATWPAGSSIMAGRMRDHDWSASSLGPIAGWPAELKSAVMLVLDTAFPAALVWGEALTTIYNDAFLPILGNKPPALGRSFAAIWAEAWDEIGPIVARAYAGEGSFLVDFPLVVDRSGRSEQAYFTFSYSPVRREDGSVAGMIDIVTETTANVEARRTLQQSERYYRALVTAGTYSVYRMSADWRWMYHLDSETLANTSGPIENWVDKYIPDEDRPEVFAAIADAIATRSVFELEHRVRLADDRIGWVRSCAVPLLHPDGTIAEWFGAGSDVTSRRYAEEALRASEERQAFLLGLSDMLRALDDPFAIQQAAMQALGRHLRVDRAMYFHVQPDAESLTLGPVYCDGVAPMPPVVRMSDFGAFTSGTYRRGETIRTDDVLADDRFDADDRAALATIQVRSAVGVPLLNGSDLAAIVSVHRSEPRTWTPAEIALIGDVAERTWMAAEHARVAVALRESEARLNALFEVVPVGIGVVDRDGRFGLQNREFERFLPDRLMPSRDIANGGVPRWFAWDAAGQPVGPDDFPGARALRGEAVVPGIEMLYVAGDGREVWTNVAALPLRDTGGAVTGHIAVITDIDGLKQHAEARRASEERLRRFGEASQDILWMRDAGTLQWTYLTPAFDRVYGLGRDEALSGDNYRTWLDLIEPEDRDAAAAGMSRARRGRNVIFEYRIRRPVDGEIRWLRDTAFPIFDAGGCVILIGGIGEDITDAKLRQERLIGSEERLRSATEVARLGLWDWNVSTGDVHWSDEHFRMEGYAIDAVTPSYDAWAARIHPDDRAATEGALHGALERRGEFDHEFRTVHPDGSVHWLHGRGRFFYDDAGSAVRMVGAMVDTTERREWEQRQAVLVAELQHRTRNLIGVIRSMADKTMQRTRDLSEFRETFLDRLEALARVQGLLSRLQDHDRVTFDELVRTELAALGVSDDADDRVILAGPKGVRLRSSTVQTLAMAVHELATNAAKYGALAQPGGQLAIAWRQESQGRDGQPWLHVDWRESGVAMPAPGAAPTGTGQGRELIERALPYQLGATTSYVLDADGVHCTISIPVSASVAAGRPPGDAPGRQ